MARILIVSLMVALLAGCAGPFDGDHMTGSPTSVNVETEGASRVITQ